ncbi:MAG: glycosyltransferase, partial [Plesiomonas shigelloides]
MNVVALIVTFNRLEKLRTCLATTLGMEFRNVVVVDNASTDGTGDWLAGIRDERLHCL